jgi:peptidoglycan DL-endopeptidase CwlO
MSMLRPLRILLPIVAIGAALLVFLSLAFVAFSIGGGAGQGGPMSLGGCDAGLSGAPGGGPVTAADLTPEQRQNAGIIVSTARSLNAPPRAWVIALATAMQESNLRNIPYGDRDSEGLFQQRPSQGWGTRTDVTDPVHATTTFIQRLLAVPGWDAMALTDAAQIVQRSAFPDAYRKWEGLATQLVTQLGQVPDPVRCAGPVAAAGVAQTAINFALAALGKPYVWGATGPDTYDCSGLMLRAFQNAGVNLPRVSREQFNAGGHLPVKQAQPGDLLFLATDPSDPATIHHVMLYMGNDKIVEAPYTGASVRVEPAPWTSRELVPLATRPGTPSNWA